MLSKYYPRMLLKVFKEVNDTITFHKTDLHVCWKVKKDRQDVLYTYNGTLFDLKEGHPVTCYNMDEPWGHYSKWNKPVTEWLNDSTYMKYLE